METSTHAAPPVALDRLVCRGCDSAPGSLGQTKLDWIRRTYGVPAKTGMRIRYGNTRDDAQDGTITGARDGRLLIRLDGWPKRRRPLAFHPTWNIHYPTNGKRIDPPTQDTDQP